MPSDYKYFFTCSNFFNDNLLLPKKTCFITQKGYGLEDDESKPGEKSFVFTLGNLNVIAALNDAMPGMKKGEIRRLSILVSLFDNGQKMII